MEEYTEELYKKDLHDPDDHNGMITHLGPDILECEIRWVLGSISKNKTSEGDRIPVELFQILKYDAVKVLHLICQQVWKTQQWIQDWKRFHFSVFIFMFHSNPKETMPKNVQAGFRKARGTRDQTDNIPRITEKARVPENIYFCFIDNQSL